MQSLADHLTVGVVVVDPTDGDAYFANRVWATMTGQDGGEWSGQGWLSVLDDRVRAATRAHLLSVVQAGAVYQADWAVSGPQHTGRVLHLSSSADPLDESAPLLVVTVTDVTEERAASQRLLHQATHDPLTGLYNRRQFLEFVSHFLKQQRRDRVRLDAVLFVDVDGLKATNDRLGHEAGDRVLRAKPADCTRRSGAMKAAAHYSGRMAGLKR